MKIREFNPDGNLTIYRVAYTFDGGTLTILARDINRQEFEIVFIQSMFLTGKQDKDTPGAILFNGNPVAVRSETEQKIIKMLKTAPIIYDDPEYMTDEILKPEYKLLNDRISFTESERYVEIARMFGRLESLDFNPVGSLNIIDFAIAQNDCSMSFILKDENGTNFDILFTQRKIQEFINREAVPGSIIVNSQLIPVRSPLEQEVIAALKSATFEREEFNTPKSPEMQFLWEWINFTESEDYVAMAKKFSRI